MFPRVVAKTKDYDLLKPRCIQLYESVFFLNILFAL